ncbi:uncharacterized protein N7477_002413 [Penicillium maclennaniae]|uniref:uncharacterized protein n=1 Tax=Penicillium maclennaniae TaxID=1343394 RepID=UPI00253FC1F9|nr:uncharacterized protein N7477_002413 [Penicillium maclennaniae]KAJ5676780.1 hypothetical protein N7477_002413 [Penicillium maclennaniae]
MGSNTAKVGSAHSGEGCCTLGEVHDIGANLYPEAEQLSTEEVAREGAQVLRILDWRLMPMLYVTYVIQFLDKLSLNYASAYSLNADLGLEGIDATLLQLPTGAFEAAIVPICGLVATYVPNSRCIVLAVISLIPFAGLLGIRFTDLDHRWTLVGYLLEDVTSQAVVDGFKDMTDMESKHFRYAL